MSTAKKPTAVRTIAVENFLGSLEGMSRQDAMQNLKLDTKCYNWNAATVRAIAAGINKHFAAKTGHLNYL